MGTKPLALSVLVSGSLNKYGSAYLPLADGAIITRFFVICRVETNAFRNSSMSDSLIVSVVLPCPECKNKNCNEFFSSSTQH